LYPWAGIAVVVITFIAFDQFINDRIPITMETVSKFKISFGFLQLTSISFGLSLRWPPLLIAVASYLKIIELDIDSFYPECYISFGWHVRLVGIVVAAPAALLILFSGYDRWLSMRLRAATVDTHHHYNISKKQSKLRNSAVILVLVGILPIVSALLEVFSCVVPPGFGEDEVTSSLPSFLQSFLPSSFFRFSVLVVDETVRCDDALHITIQVVSALLLFVVMGGTVYVMWWLRNFRLKGGDLRDLHEKMGALFESYEEKVLWFEGVRLFHTYILLYLEAFVIEDPLVQAAAAIGTHAVYGLLLMMLRPFRETRRKLGWFGQVDLLNFAEMICTLEIIFATSVGLVGTMYEVKSVPPPPGLLLALSVVLIVLYAGYAVYLVYISVALQSSHLNVRMCVSIICVRMFGQCMHHLCACAYSFCVHVQVNLNAEGAAFFEEYVTYCHKQNEAARRKSDVTNYEKFGVQRLREKLGQHLQDVENSVEREQFAQKVVNEHRDFILQVREKSDSSLYKHRLELVVEDFKSWLGEAVRNRAVRSTTAPHDQASLDQSLACLSEGIRTTLDFVGIVEDADNKIESEGNVQHAEPVAKKSMFSLRRRTNKVRSSENLPSIRSILSNLGPSPRVREMMDSKHDAFVQDYRVCLQSILRVFFSEYSVYLLELCQDVAWVAFASEGLDNAFTERLLDSLGVFEGLEQYRLLVIDDDSDSPPMPLKTAAVSFRKALQADGARDAHTFLCDALLVVKTHIQATGADFSAPLSHHEGQQTELEKVASEVDQSVRSVKSMSSLRPVDDLLEESKVDKFPAPVSLPEGGQVRVLMPAVMDTCKEQLVIVKDTFGVTQQLQTCKEQLKIVKDTFDVRAGSIQGNGANAETPGSRNSIKTAVSLEPSKSNEVTRRESMLKDVKEVADILSRLQKAKQELEKRSLPDEGSSMRFLKRHHDAFSQWAQARAQSLRALETECTFYYHDTNVADFIRLIFDKETIVRSMKDLNVDTNKMPLNKISKPQIQKGIDALLLLEKEVKKRSPKQALLQDCSKQFYTTIPHYFGDSEPPLIDTLEMVKKKFDFLNILANVETVVAIRGETCKVLDPLHAQYSSLDTDLELVDQSSKEFKEINQYMVATKSPAGGASSGVDRSIIDVFRVNRHDESARYSEFDKVENRKLLWHGTNVAVVAAILKGGMRIMPHTGGEFCCAFFFSYTCLSHVGHSFLCVFAC
jgi:hypothetical protein